MPRGVRDKKPQNFTLSNTLSIDQIDHLLRHATADELFDGILEILDPGTRASIFAAITQARYRRITEAPANLSELADSIQSFGPQSHELQAKENSDHAQAGNDPA